MNDEAFDRQVSLLQRVRAERQRPGHPQEVDDAWEAWMLAPSGDRVTQERLERSVGFGQ